MTRYFFSVIIPYYNSAETIGNLLRSLRQSIHPPTYEIIVIDDGSKTPLKVKDSKLKIIRRQANRGPAAARNAGAKAAKGKYLLFLDSDVEVYSDTLANLAKIYTDPDIVAVTGVWTKEQKSKEFFPNFKALRDWSYWMTERDVHGYYYLFSTRIASIKKAVFQRLGGFDESYQAALVEDIELTYRIARRYAVIFAPQVRVRHEFEGFWPIAKKYFWRAYHWTKLYSVRKKFDPVATTEKEALAAISGVGVVMSLLFFSLSDFIAFIGLGLLLVHFWLIRKFLLFVFKEKGLLFALKSFFVGIALYCFIASGALWAKIKGQFFRSQM